ncbi:MAG: PIN domain-containing protein [Acidimicrobiaceae bacterium]|nr:PIN domain-containing protein [Acidimicrobiaceae bacterium]MXW60515.1 PIN domain-containing protein [Acidimicrobiaceae bacterium]MXW74615.1 PIN domain-containing protein [Acidimicrobiaceae bacterium]MYA73355.1 PIN domain-containing protein [Acidimicrobiaceae bacterium]MYC43528.1 PIN domain-containing protein [Acidimicrobiaceae bacterium]
MDWIYVDTSAWVSMADSAEASHDRIADSLSNNHGRLITADHVLQETWTVMRYRHGGASAEALVNAIRAGIARVEVSLLADLEVAAAIGLAFGDQDFSLSDRTSWAVMERLGLSGAISLDRDFRVYRYGPDRRRAFNVLP